MSVLLCLSPSFTHSLDNESIMAAPFWFTVYPHVYALNERLQWELFMRVAPVHTFTVDEKQRLISDLIAQGNASAAPRPCRSCNARATGTVSSRFTRGDHEYAWCASVCERLACHVYLQGMADQERDAVRANPALAQETQ